MFGRFFKELAKGVDETSEMMIDATHRGAHPTADSRLKKGALPRYIGRTQDGLHSKLYAVCNSAGLPIDLFLTAYRVDDYAGAAVLLGTKPTAKVVLAYKGYGADWLRDSLSDRKVEPSIASKSNRKIQIPDNRTHPPVGNFTWHREQVDPQCLS